MTILQDALAQAGHAKRDVEVATAISKFRNAGGTLERLFELVDAAYADVGEGVGQRFAPARPEISEAISESEGGHQGPDAQHTHAPLAPREPSEAEKRAAAYVAAQAALTLMDKLKLHDGTAIGDVRWRDLDKRIEQELNASREFMAQSGERARCAIVLQRVQGLVANARPMQFVREVVSLPLLEKAWQESEDTDAA